MHYSDISPSSSVSEITPDVRAALIVAHPGHELCVRGWLGLARPQVFVLTDGSGRASQSRLTSTTKVLSEAGAASGSVYGRLTDQAVYTALLTHNYDLFIRLVEELAETFRRERISYVAGDAIEGYNPTHDVCRLMIGAAVEVANRTGERRIANFDFSLIGRQDHCPAELHADAIWLHLDENTLAQKLAAMRTYPELAAEVEAGLDGKLLAAMQAFPELAAEIQSVTSGLGIDAFRTECLRPVKNETWKEDVIKGSPFYERYGERQVAAGYYPHVIRYRDHFIPLAEAIWRWLETS
jgi:hypothetical protein